MGFVHSHHSGLPRGPLFYAFLFVTPMTTAPTYTQIELVDWFREQTDDLLACDPSIDENSQARFIEIQLEGEELAAAIEAAGFTYEQIEQAADSE